jgi:hypothetical protein
MLLQQYAVNTEVRHGISIGRLENQFTVIDPRRRKYLSALKMMDREEEEETKKVIRGEKSNLKAGQ